MVDIRDPDAFRFWGGMQAHLLQKGFFCQRLVFSIKWHVFLLNMANMRSRRIERERETPKLILCLCARTRV